MKRYKRLAAAAFTAAFLLAAFFEPMQAQSADETQYWPAGPEIAAASGIVMEASTGTVLYEKNSHSRQYPASITKILTALLAIENSSMDEIVTFSHDAVYETAGGSGIARDVGEQMTMEQCLYGMMLASANECAYAIGEHVGGSMQAFVQMMNDRAKALGCTDTNFNNSSGLPDEAHYTSAYDMALIAREAYKNEAFRIICGRKTYTIPVTNKHKDEETYLQNHHQMLYPLKTRKYLYEYCLGGKTGYTIAANSTLVTYAEKDGMTLICVVLNAPASIHYEDTRALFDFCFDNFKEMNVLENETSYAQQDQGMEGILGSYEPFVALDPSAGIILPITAEFADAESEIVYDKENANVLGNIRYTYAGRPVGAADITATNANVDSFQFQGESGTENAQGSLDDADAAEADDAFRIDKRDVFLILLGIAALAAAILFFRKFADNFYNIKRKFRIGTKQKSPYKTIKPNKMWRKRRKW